MALFTECWARLRRTSKGWGSLPGLAATGPRAE